MTEAAPRLDLEQAKHDIEQAIRKRPRLRGVTHQWAFFISLVLGVALVATAPPGKGTLAAAVYAACVTLLFGASALYHRVTWRTPNARRWMRRLDHSAIFLLIAGTYTPFALLVLHGSLADVVLAVMWSGAVGGILLKLLWIDAPKRLAAVIYVALGSVAVAVTPDMIGQIGVVASILVAAGGILYTLGAVTYALRRPDPVPAVFGYHEVFHALVIVAAALQYAVIAFWVLPQA
ncbi:MAG: hemolysin III family protein [Actinomycetota bacterium]|nr:hemolysin III family protein [Actinomycetota bacterium]